jgi:hypothetical protein
VYTNAKTYLKNTQLADGGWGYGNSDVLTTAWVVMGINALGESQNDWFKNEVNPWYILVNNLSADGSYQISSSQNTDWFATKHAVPALLKKTWPITNITNITNYNNDGVGGSTEDIISTATTTPTTTLDNIIIATSTPTTTLDILISTTTTATSTTEKIPKQFLDESKKNLDPSIPTYPVGKPQDDKTNQDSKMKKIKIFSDLSPKEKEEIAEKVSIGALKYSILRCGAGKNIMFDFEKATELRDIMFELQLEEK